MKTFNKYLILLFITSPALAQFETIADIDKQRQDLEKTLQQQKEYTKLQTDRLEQEKAKVAEKKKQLADLENYEMNFAQSRIIALAELNESIKSLPLFQKVGGKASFYKCLRKSLEDNGHMTYDNCQRYHSPKLSSDEKAKLEEIKKSVGMPLKDAERIKSELPREISRAEEMFKTMESNINYSTVREEMIASSIQATETKKSELKLIPTFEKFTNCDANSPEINLEEKVPYTGADFQGAFFGVPRDNQDGVGSCYANAAKNLLVGISEGKDVASFLDLALIYKKNSGGLQSDGLDGGGSCPTLKAAAKSGYCPQNYAPLENGDRNFAGEGLFKLGPYEYLATNISLVRDFLAGLDNFEKSKSPVKEEVLGRAQVMIEAIKKDKNITLPLPVARFEIPEEWKLRETYVVKKNHPGLPDSPEKFINEYHDTYKAFYPKYVKAVFEGKSLDAIFDIYQETMKPFIDKYSLHSSLPEYKRVFKNNAERDFKDPELKTKLRASLDFLKDVMNKKETSDGDFIEFCTGSGQDSLKFLGSLQPLIDKLRTDKLNGDQLFDKDGKFRSAAELMQLTVAPSCINEENRKPLPSFSCHDGYDTMTKIKSSGKSQQEQIKAVREKVVLSLAQGYPLGNSFPTGNNSAHINTIVGIRFNPAMKRCEYRIRESQTGTSDWHSEEGIFTRMYALTEVRRSK